MKFFRFVLFLLFLAIACLAAAVYLTSRPYKSFEGDRFVTIAKGTTTRQIAARLQEQGVVPNEWTFLLARALSPSTKLQAGEYRFSEPASAREVLDRIHRGDIFYLELTVPEGHNLFDIANDIKKLHLFSDADFLRAAKNPALIRDLDSEATSLEGYLWPDTYRIVPTTTAAQLCATMTHKFRAKWKELNTKANVHKSVTLASLVEREARIPSDRPLVSSVFHNRLRQGIRLDCDPTTVYAALLEGRYRGTIYRSDLDNPNPYNTYKNAGLPPGPIANPGLSSLQAAIKPADTQYLFFVVKPGGAGAHVFSETLAAHNAAAAAYHRAQSQ